MVIFHSYVNVYQRVVCWSVESLNFSILNWHLTSDHRDIVTSTLELKSPHPRNNWCFLGPCFVPCAFGVSCGLRLLRDPADLARSRAKRWVFSVVCFFLIVQIKWNRTWKYMEHVQKSFKSFWSLCPSVTCQVHSFKCDVRWGHHVGVAFFQLWIPCPACLWRRDLPWCQPVGHGAEKKTSFQGMTAVLQNEKEEGRMRYSKALPARKKDVKLHISSYSISFWGWIAICALRQPQRPQRPCLRESPVVLLAISESLPCGNDLLPEGYVDIHK